MHPLDHAHLRLDWAKKRFAELEALYAAHLEEEANALRKNFRIHLDINSSIPDIFCPEKPCLLIPVSFPILIGEIAHHLRASLDYLVHRLAILDSGSVQDHTQFPLDKYQKRFTGKKPHVLLKGINITHTAAIERLQPYNGVNWTRNLADISNRDKHNDLVITSTRSAVAMRVGINPSKSTDRTGDDAGVIFFGSVDPRNTTIRQACNIAPDQPMYIEFHVPLFITFDNGSHVMNTLQEIETEVANTLAYFKPEF
jgi:hypothetical protein